MGSLAKVSLSHTRWWSFSAWGPCVYLGCGGLGGSLPLLSPQLALPHLRKSQGNIINISSLVGALGQPQALPYVATKVGQAPPGSPKSRGLGGRAFVGGAGETIAPLANSQL